MWSWRVLICTILRRYSDSSTKLDHLHQVLHAGNFTLGKSYDVNIVFGIFSSEKQIFLIQEIVKFTTINLVEWNPHWKVGFLLNYFEDIVSCQ